jgi:hypothetical protein
MDLSGPAKPPEIGSSTDVIRTTLCAAAGVYVNAPSGNSVYLICELVEDGSWHLSQEIFSEFWIWRPISRRTPRRPCASELLSWRTWRPVLAGCYQSGRRSDRASHGSSHAARHLLGQAPFNEAARIAMPCPAMVSSPGAAVPGPPTSWSPQKRPFRFHRTGRAAAPGGRAHGTWCVPTWQLPKKSLGLADPHAGQTTSAHQAPIDGQIGVRITLAL